jgi:hypothetical protein
VAKVKTVDAAWFPEGFTPDATWESFEVEPGIHVRYPTLEPADWIRLLEVLRAAGRSLGARPVREVVLSLGRTAERFLDPEDPMRLEALEWLVPTAGISAEMAGVVLTGMARDWTSDRLAELLERELGVPEVLDGFRPLDSGRTVHATGPTLSFHVGAGTVPGVSVSSLIRALLVKSAVLLKPGRGDVTLPVLFARALAEEDPELAAGVAVAYWPGGDSPAEALALEGAEVVVAYGSSEAVTALRDRTPVTSRFVAYHHRVSVGMVGRDALHPDKAASVAADAALAVSMFDQRGCVSPHVLYVERGGGTDPGAWAGVLAEAMAQLDSELPGGRLTPDEASTLHQVRGAAGLEEASGAGSRVYSGERGSWTVIYQENPAFTLSCQNRVVYVKPVGDLAEVPELLNDLRRYLQTVALSGVGGRRGDLATALGRVGVTRITSFRGAPWPPPWWHHDGASVFDGLIRWIDLEDE